MSNQKSNKENLALAESVAANQLMTQWVKENASEVAGAISNLVPFICGECDTAGLEHSMNIVNTVLPMSLSMLLSHAITSMKKRKHLYVYQLMQHQCKMLSMNFHDF